MTASRSKLRSVLGEVGKLTLALVLLPVAFFLIVLGPPGWILLLVAVAIGIMVMGGLDPEETSDTVNCPECGAPNDADSDACEYCEATL